MKGQDKAILDDHLAFKGEKIVQPKLVNWTSIIILWIGILYSIFNGLIYQNKFITGIVMLLITTIFCFSNFKLGVKVTLGIIIFGVLDLVDFFPIKFNFEINGLGIGFDFVLVIIGIIHFFTNREQLFKSTKNFLNLDLPEEEIKAVSYTHLTLPTICSV